jgi:predicted enzyme related to lactoylglutathione lyase
MMVPLGASERRLIWRNILRHYRVNFSHFGIKVTDLAKMTDFYSRILGFPATDHGLLHGMDD